MSYLLPIPGAILLSDAAVTLSRAELNRRLVMTPTIVRVITLPTTGVIAGEMAWLQNLATSVKFTIEASGGVDIASFQNGSMQLMALQNAPTLATHWRILGVDGGASPCFHVHKNGTVQSVSSSTYVKIVWSTEEFDTNDDFDLTNERWQPSVPGKYLLTMVTALSSADRPYLSLFKNGADYKNDLLDTVFTEDRTRALVVVVDANGFDDDYEMFIKTIGGGGVNVSGPIRETYWSGCRMN